MFKYDLSYVNKFANFELVPKIGNEIESNIWSKIFAKNRNNKLVTSLKNEHKYKFYLNMRCTFWVKCLLNKQKSNEYRLMSFNNEDEMYFYYCLLNSSLFWWYWTTISDCWHITNKELSNISLPNKIDFTIFKKVAIEYDKALEDSKEFIYSKQTEYVYKHKNCWKKLQKINKLINDSFGLSEAESEYICSFAKKYRMGEGA